MDASFTNDEIFDIIKQNGDINKNWMIDDLESFFIEICDKRIIRNIAQNFTTMWFKISKPIKLVSCNSCKLDIHVGDTEKECPNPNCKKEFS